jgi:hypothetical protein
MSCQNADSEYQPPGPDRGQRESQQPRKPVRLHANHDSATSFRPRRAVDPAGPGSELLLEAVARPPSGGLQEQPENCACQDELYVGTEPSGAMPAAPVEELPAVWTQLREDVLEVRCGGRARPERGWIERPTTEREQPQREQAASNLK